jgi:DNA-binding GntR family transcriptional regulator
MATQSAREIAYQALWNRIIRMELRPGDPLNDHRLAEEMGISRTPVREAILMLNLAHMVTIKPQSGTHVAPIDLQLMAMEQFARYTLEKEMLLRACAKLTEEDISRYRENVAAYSRCLQQPATSERNTQLLELDNAFHRLAFELNGMETHFDHMLSTFQHIERLRMFSLMTGESGSYVCEDHTNILRAMVDKDTDALSAALDIHLQRYKQSVRKAKCLNPLYFVNDTSEL